MSTPCQPCGEIVCVIPSDYSLYDLEDCKPGSGTPTFANATVFFPLTPCPDGGNLVFTGTLPSWISLDTVNSQFIGSAGTFTGSSVSETTATAQAALNVFGAAQVAAGNLICSFIYAIEGYFPGMITNSGTSNCGSGEWDGTFKSYDSPSTTWFAIGSGCVLVDGFDVCTVNIAFTTPGGIPTWTLTLANPVTFWIGDLTGSTTPDGVYTQTGGTSPGPATITIIKVGGVPTTGSMICT